jgi:mono/diheme cytochrome c family protein
MFAARQMTLFLALSMVLAVAVPAVPLAADIRHGEQIARRWCSSCHIIGEAPTAAVPQGPPTFLAIARSDLTDGALRAFLSHPHASMPDLSLSRAEMDDLIGYIEEIRHSAGVVTKHPEH